MAQGLLQIAIFVAVVVAVVPLLGGYMARVFTGERVLISPVVAPVERGVLRLLGVEDDQGQSWKQYARTLLAFSALSWLFLYLILRTQTLHPGNGRKLTSGTWDVTFNTVSSFVTNTNWQFYGGESTLTNFSQAFGLTVQNFVSAGVGIAVAIALIRGIANRRGDGRIGHFWRDLVRAILYVLLPISLVGALFLVSQGVVQSFPTQAGDLITGPVGSQEAIKELGTNGGGFFNVNSSFPFENPTGLTNFVEMLLILIVPASLTSTFGRMVGSRRQGWSIFAAMSFLFLVGVALVFFSERHGTSAQQLAGVTGGNLEGKEVRFGTTGSALWTAVTTVTSCGAVNASLDSLTALGGLTPFLNLGYSESVFGGVGTGLYTMLFFVLLAVFIGGLMVGRTPEYLGKKVEARDIKFVALGSVFTPLLVLVTSGLALAWLKYGGPSIDNSGPQGFSETIYAYLSQANNNGSAFAGYTGYVQPDPNNVGAYGITFADVIGGLTMLFGRFAPILFVLAVAGSLSGKTVTPAGLGTMRTDTPTFVVLLIGVVVLLAALTFVPALLLGPIVQSLSDTLF